MKIFLNTTDLNNPKIEISGLEKHLTKLESVGCYYDTNNGMVYPIIIDGSPDLAMGIELWERSDEWIESLSSEDYKKLVPNHLLRF